MKSFTVLFVVINLFLITSVSLAQTTILLDENFDSYQPGVLPSGWQQVWSGAGWEYQVVTNEQSFSSPNSFKMKGMWNWGACIEYPLDPLPEVIYFKSKIFVTEGTGEQVTIGPWRRNDGAWGTDYCGIHFMEGKIKLSAIAGGGFLDLMPYERNRWYDVKVKYEATARTATVWVDNQLIVADVAMSIGGLGYNAIRLHNGWGGIVGYYDDMKVWTDQEQPQRRIFLYTTRATGQGIGVRRIDFDEDLPNILAQDSFSVRVEDRQSLASLDASLLANYDQLWFVTTESSPVLSAAEVQAIQDFHADGKGIMIIGDGYEYTAPAIQFSSGWGVQFDGSGCWDCDHCGGPIGCPVSTAGFPAHEIWTNVSQIQANLNEGNLTATPPGQIIASHNGINMVGISEGSGGRVAWDATVYRFTDSSAHPNLAITYYDNAQYARNLARWLAGGPPPPCTTVTHFTFKDNTEDSYSLAVDSALFCGVELEECDEIGVFDGNLCVGASVYHPDSLPLDLVAWQDDSQTPEIDGYICGHEMSFRVWKRSSDEEIGCQAHYSVGDGTFCYGAYSQLWLGCRECQNIALSPGWQWISTNTAPVQPEIESLFVNCWDDLNIIKAGDGSFCIPDIGCWISGWDVHEMYTVHMADACAIQVCGNKVPVNTPIHLPAGWNYVAYFPECPLEPEFALASIWNKLDIVKNDEGEFCIPDVGCWIDCMEYNEGYKVHLFSADTLVYPTSCPPPFAKKNSFPGFAKTAHFNYLGNTGESYSIVVNSIELNGKLPEVGDEIGVFTSSGLCVGGGVWQGDILGMAAWHDDERTETVDGFQVGEQMIFKLWDKSENKEIELSANFEKGEGKFGSDAYAMVNLKGVSSQVPEKFELAQNHPNPFNPTTSIKFAVGSGQWAVPSPHHPEDIQHSRAIGEDAGE